MSHSNRAMMLTVVFALTLSFSTVTHAQVQTGEPPFSSIGGSSTDQINLGGLNVHVVFPVMQKSGRGLPFNYTYSYDSSVWYPSVSGSNTVWTPTINFGWHAFSSVATGFISAQRKLGSPCPLSRTTYVFIHFNFSYIEPNGTSHPFPGQAYDRSACGQANTDANVTTTDGSGMFLHYGISDPSYVVTTDGSVITPGSTYEDRNGNYVTTASGYPSSGYVFTDTLGTNVLTTGLTSSNPVSLTYTGPSGPISVQVHYTTKTVQTKFLCSGISDYGPQTQSLPDRITYPDGSYYAITYEATPYGVSGAVTGRIASVRLPTGGTISYQYTGPNFGIVCADGSTGGLTRTTPDGTWTYSRDVANAQTTVTDPAQNRTVVKFTPNGGNFYESSRYEYQGTSTLIRTVQTCYNGHAAPCDGAAVSLPITQKTVSTTLAGLSGASKVDVFFNTNGQVTETDEYDFGASTATRKTLTSYASLGNVKSMPSSVTINDGSGNTIAQTNYTYDEYALVATTGTPQHVNAGTTRGNATTISRLVSGTTYVTQHLHYYDTGNVQQAFDSLNNGPTYTYGDCGNSFLTQVSLPLNLSGSISWNCSGGVVSSITDENSQTISYTYGDSNSWRVTQVSYPDGGQGTTSYNTGSATPWTTNTAKIITGTRTLNATITLDGLGRVSQSQITSDPDGISTVDQTYGYNTTGFLSTASNPYRSTSDPIYGITFTQTDAIGRLKSVTRPDGNVVSATYSGNCVTYLDEANKQRKQCSDGLGRITSVFEPDTSNSLTWETDYQYDVLDNLTGVIQKGGSGNSGDWRIRSFSYDGLSRMTQENTPEGGIVNYSYSGSCSGSPAQVCSRTDARGTATTYAYDTLHRLTSRTYSDGTPTVAYFYDQTSYNGLTISNGNGRRTGMSDGTGSTAWSYDSMGRVLTRRQTISGISKNTSHTYNLDGSVASITYPSGRTVNYAYNNAALPISATDGGSGIKYVSNAHYNAAGLLTSMYDGESAGWISITRTNTFNSRLQVTRLQASSPLPLNMLDLSYSYDQGSGKNNGSVVQITNNRDTARSIAFTYDQLNRVLTAQTPNSSLWGDSFMIDAWGNLLQKNVIKGTAETLNVTVNSKNQISTGGYTYDLSGNLLTDTLNTLLFNAENQATPRSGTVYSYDGDGRRVIKSGNNFYWVDDDFSPLTLTDTSGNSQRDFIFFNGQRVGMFVFSDQNPYYYLGDVLGSTSLISSGDGKAVQWEADYYPYGGTRLITSNVTNYYQFTGYEKDSDTGYYYAVNRIQSPNLSRFFSPDRIAGSVGNPQSWNRYAYVQNRPVTAVDPMGMDIAGCPAEFSYDDCGGDFGFWGADLYSFGDDVARFNRQYAGVPANMIPGLQQYQLGLDCAFNPGSCPDGVPQLFSPSVPGKIFVPKGCETYVAVDMFGNVTGGPLGCNAGFFMDENQWAGMMATYKDEYNAGRMYVQYMNMHPQATREDFKIYQLSLQVYWNTTHPFTPCEGAMLSLWGLDQFEINDVTLGAIKEIVSRGGGTASILFDCGN